MQDIRIIERPPQRVAVVGIDMTMDDFGPVIAATDRVAEWLEQYGLEATGAPFFRYVHVAMPRLVVETGFPVTDEVVGEADVRALTLPGGRFATTTHHGHPDGLREATAGLLTWARRHGHEFDVVETPDGQEWACRLELYETDPAEEPDMDAWDTVLAFKLRD